MWWPFLRSPKELWLSFYFVISREVFLKLLPFSSFWNILKKLPCWGCFIDCDGPWLTVSPFDTADGMGSVPSSAGELI